MYWIFGAIEELLPLIAFFAIEGIYGFNAGVFGMVTILILLTVSSILLQRTLPRFALVSTLLVLVFTLATLLTGDPAYFQFSDTLLEGILGIVLLVSWWHKRPLLKSLFGRVFAITDYAWLLLTRRWGIILTLSALGNEIIRLTSSTDAWTLYKFISTGGILLFGCYQFTVSMRYRIKGEANRFGLRIH